MKKIEWSDFSKYRSALMGAAMLFVMFFHVSDGFLTGMSNAVLISFLCVSRSTKSVTDLKYVCSYTVKTVFSFIFAQMVAFYDVFRTVQVNFP